MSRTTGVDTYIAEVKKRSGYRATWLPTATINPGDIGRLHGQRFIAETSLSALGIAVTVTEGDTSADYEFSSSTVHIEAGAAATAALGATPAATLRIGFRDKDGFFSAAYGCTSTRIGQLDDLNQEVLRLEGQGRWDTSWLIATEVVAAKSAVILISESSGAFAEIDCRAGATAGLAPIASLRGAFRLGAFTGLRYKTVASGRVTPLFIAHGLTGRRHNTHLNPRGSSGTEQDTGKPRGLHVLP
jgi:hypothetical protein